MYDYIIVGAGLFGAVCANELKKDGKKILVLEKRSHIAGNIFTESVNGVHVHKYGAHIFHTNDDFIWDYINSFAKFNRFTNAPLALSKGRLYNLPFNMNTFNQLWGVKTPDEAKKKIDSQRSEVNGRTPVNLEEQAISLVGRDIYETLIKGYTEKQWGRKCVDLPAFIIKRLPVRFTFDNNYFSDKYQGIPIGGYTQIVEKMLNGVEVKLGVDYLVEKEKYSIMAKNVIFTGPIDAYFNYQFGRLDYRTLRFEHQEFFLENFQGNAVINYTDAEIPYTRTIEHKHFDPVDIDFTVVTKEYPKECLDGDEPYYPVNDDVNSALYKKYKALADSQRNVIFGGRLAEYKYYDMHQVIGSALATVRKIKAA
jgi:UDP-galactopyranose mutase